MAPLSYKHGAGPPGARGCPRDWEEVPRRTRWPCSILMRGLTASQEGRRHGYPLVWEVGREPGCAWLTTTSVSPPSVSRTPSHRCLVWYSQRGRAAALSLVMRGQGLRDPDGPDHEDVAGPRLQPRAPGSKFTPIFKCGESTRNTMTGEATVRGGPRCVRRYAQSLAGHRSPTRRSPCHPLFATEEADAQRHGDTVPGAELGFGLQRTCRALRD